jgi:hypothetical protein
MDETTATAILKRLEDEDTRLLVNPPCVEREGGLYVPLDLRTILEKRES